MAQWWTTKTLGEDGIIRDLSRLEFLPKDVMAINAWAEPVTDEEHAASLKIARRKLESRPEDP